MKKLTPIIEHYNALQVNITKQNLPKSTALPKQISLIKNLLYELRISIRKSNFQNKQDEIHFFKHVKPKFCSQLILYNCQLNFDTLAPNSTYTLQKKYIDTELKNLERKKRKNLEFYKYYKRRATFLDHIYFIRENGQLFLFDVNVLAYFDQEFFTSHDMKAAEVLAYNLLSDFYKCELQKIHRLENQLLKPITQINRAKNLNWTASKTDLVELIYALQKSGTINNGTADIKKMAMACEQLFDIDLGDYYRTFLDIRARKINQTKFIDKLKIGLESKLLESDE